MRLPAWAALLFSVMTLLSVYYTVRQNAEKHLQRQTSSLMEQLLTQLDSVLERHNYLPGLLAENRAIQALLSNTSGQDQELPEYVNRTLAKANRTAGTAEIYLMDPDGMTIAASNWDQNNSFVGKNFSFRPYFKQAIQGRLGRYFALGTTSGERGYYFAAGVRDADGVLIGVIAVKVDVTPQETDWDRNLGDFIVADPDGVIFMSSNPRWQLHSLHPLSTTLQKKLLQSLRYADRKITPLPDGLRINPLLREQRVNDAHKDYLVQRTEKPSVGWNVYMLTDRGSVTRTIALSLLLALLMLTLTWLLLYLLWKNHRQRREYEQRTLEELETKVEERTRELRQTQEELVQAAKMAALGQLSAGINHELNNPLTAIRAYADNAAQFLDIGKTDIARNNLTEIVSLTERMAAITRQLKTFSRKSAGQVETCDLHLALTSALSIVQPKLTQHHITLEQHCTEETRYVQADLVWLEQILVNLLSNAAEAVQDQEERLIRVSLQACEGQVCVSVHDNGDGISEEAMPHVFEAFFTTKTIGKGLGLGLSISYRLAREMHGNLNVRNAGEGGAVFTLTLQQANEGRQT